MPEAGVIEHGAQTSTRTPSPDRAGPSGGAPDRPWLAHYPAGVPAEIETAGLGTLVDLFEASVAAFADRPAMLCFDAQMSYARMGQDARALSAWLRAEGLEKGDRVAIMLPNVPAYAVAVFGVLRAGGTVVNINPLFTPREFAAQVKDSGARILIVMENFGPTVEAALAEVSLDRVALVRPGDGLGFKGRVVDLASRHVRRSVPDFSLPDGLAVRFRRALIRGRRLPDAPAAIGPDDLAFLQYTGGTTGGVKAAMLTHANAVANAEQCQVWFDVKDASVRRCVVVALPLYHIFALQACLIQFVRSGGACLLIPNPRDCDGMVRTLGRHRFTHLMGVNTLFNVLINHPKIADVDFAHLDFVIGGGTAVQRVVAERWEALTGCPISEGYGLTETAPVVSVNPPRRPFSGTIGFPLPSTDIAIRGLDGEPVPQGQPGELCVRGPQVMRGYWNKPAETAQATTRDGYFRTGDIALLEADGQVRIVDRLKDMILVSGFNVYPNEVEDVLAAHPGVLECAVVGAPSAETGEMVVAHVVLRDGGTSVDALRAHARGQLTGYKVPRRVVLHEALPKTNVGKVLRRVLREEFPPPEA